MTEAAAEIPWIPHIPADNAWMLPGLKITGFLSNFMPK
jgi:hypothetical protein